MVVSKRPSHSTTDTLEVDLLPLFEELLLVGYQLQAMGEVVVTFPVPLELSRDDLGDRMSLRIVACDFIFVRHQTLTRWKDASRLVQHDRLEFSKTVAPASRAKSTMQLVPQENSLATLKTNPLALQLALTVADGVCHSP